jgi:hypothetical protein
MFLRTGLKVPKAYVQGAVLAGLQGNSGGPGH